MEPKELTMSTLSKTWIFDLDGTLVRHNGYKTGCDEFLPGAKEFLSAIPDGDMVLILTAREKEARDVTEDFLRTHGVRYDRILFEVPMGERILLNDSKPSGLRMSYAVECNRNEGLTDLKINIDEEL